jgi:NAD(P)H-flavin reductase
VALETGREQRAGDKSWDQPELGARPMAPRFLKVRRTIRESRDTVTLVISDPAASSVFAPGQFNMLYAFGAGEAAISISGDPADPALMLHTIRGVGRVTNPLASMKRGATVGIRGPFGRGWPVEIAVQRAGTILLLAGGIGLAPLRPVIYFFLRNRAAVNRVVLLYGSRTPADLIYQKEVEAWGRSAGIELYTIVDRGDASWRGRVGILTDLLDSCRLNAAETIAMICGPEVMMRAAAYALSDRGVAAEDIFLSMERNMKCAIGICGHCQFGPSFVCKDGPVFRFAQIAHLLGTREV